MTETKVKVVFTHGDHIYGINVAASGKLVYFCPAEWTDTFRGDAVVVDRRDWKILNAIVESMV